MYDPVTNTIDRIRQLMPYLPLEKIHDRLIAAGVTEEDFYLCWHAAQIMEKHLDLPVVE